MKIIKNFFITIKTKGFIVSFLAIKNFFKILLVNFFSSSTFIKKRIFNYQMYLDPRDKGISRTLLLFGERELDHKIILEKVLRKDMKVFDIGANIGYYVLMESSILGINGRIVAVEPVPKNMHLLKKNLELNKNNITPITIKIAAFLNIITNHHNNIIFITILILNSFFRFFQTYEINKSIENKEKVSDVT